MRTRLLLAATLLAALAFAQSATDSITYRSPGGTTLKIMLDDRNVGKEVAVGEMVFAPNQDSAEHTHGAIEMFYVISGEYTHVVNGQAYVLKPGMAGYVKIGDKIKPFAKFTAHFFDTSDLAVTIIQNKSRLKQKNSRQHPFSRTITHAITGRYAATHRKKSNVIGCERCFNQKRRDTQSDLAVE